MLQADTVRGTDFRGTTRKPVRDQLADANPTTGLLSTIPPSDP